MQEIPDLRALVERHQDDPFALIGINTDDDKDAYRERAAEKEINWRDAWTGGPFSEIPKAWGVRVYPTNFVLDHEGRIRGRDVHGEEREKLVAELIAAAKRAE